jgi:hypothetical protein
MQEILLLMSRSVSLLLALPVVVLLFISVFGLDQLIAAPKAALNRRRPACGIDKDGQPIVCDPDGARSVRR